MFSLRRFKPVGTLKFPAPLLHWSVGPPFADAANYTLRFSIRKTKKAARGGSEPRAAFSVKILLSTGESACEREPLREKNETEKNICADNCKLSCEVFFRANISD